MTRKLTTEEKLKRKKMREKIKKINRQMKYLIAMILLITGFIGVIRINHMPPDEELACGFFAGIGLMMVEELMK